MLPANFSSNSGFESIWKRNVWLTFIESCVATQHDDFIVHSGLKGTVLESFRSRAFGIGEAVMNERMNFI